MNEELKDKIEKLFLFFGESILDSNNENIISENFSIRTLSNKKCKISICVKRECKKDQFSIFDLTKNKTYHISRGIMYGVEISYALEFLRSLLFEIKSGCMYE